MGTLVEKGTLSYQHTVGWHLAHSAGRSPWCPCLRTCAGFVFVFTELCAEPLSTGRFLTPQVKILEDLIAKHASA